MWLGPDCEETDARIDGRGEEEEVEPTPLSHLVLDATLAARSAAAQRARSCMSWGNRVPPAVPRGIVLSVFEARKVGAFETNKGEERVGFGGRGRCVGSRVRLLFWCTGLLVA